MAWSLLTPARRDVLIVVAGLLLLMGPLWAAMLAPPLADHRYDRERVVAENGTIRFAGEYPGRAMPLSEDLACANRDYFEGYPDRGCFVERYLARNNTIRTNVTYDEVDWQGFYDRYEYALVNGSVYEPAYDKRQLDRPRPDSLARFFLTVRPVRASNALANISVAAEDVPDPVARAARTGEATTVDAVTVPETPIRLENGSYYRVAESRFREDPARSTPVVIGLNLLRYLAPLVGLFLPVRAVRQFDLVHASERE